MISSLISLAVALGVAYYIFLLSEKNKASRKHHTHH